MKSLLMLALVLGGCQSHSDGDVGPASVNVAKSSLARASDPSTADLDALARSNRAFAFDLYRQIAQSRAGQNIVFSPYSLSSAFAMTYAGAKNETHEQIGAVFHFDLPEPQLHEAFNAATQTLPMLDADDQPIVVTLSNGLWMANGAAIEKPFLDTLALNYGAGVFLFNGEPEDTRLAINAEVSKETKMSIPELLPQGAIDTLTRFVLTDAVYLNARWFMPFTPSRTHDAPFTKSDGSTVVASMMQGVQSGSYAAGDGYQAISVFYAEGVLRFIAVVPDTGNFDAWEASLDAAWFERLNASWSDADVDLGLPKLEFGEQVSVKDQLRALGMTAPFDDDADFSAMTPEKVFVKNVFHQATIKVVEEGTIATAASGVVINSKSGARATSALTLDRPFLFAITTGGGEPLFLGRVLDPTAQ